MAPDSALGAKVSAEEALGSIVGAEYVRAGGSSDSVAGMPAQLVVQPCNESELAAVLRYVNENGLRVATRGGGTKLSWGNPPTRIDLVLSTARLDKIIEHAWPDQTVTVEAGCTIQHLQDRLAQHGQRLAFDTAWPEQSTVGGVLSANESGALRLRFGGLRDLVIGVTLALPDGTLARSGGKVVKNVAGYDLPKLVTGAMGTLGVITRAVFRLHPLPQNTRTLSIGAPDLPEMQSCLAAILDSQLAPSAVQARLSENAAPEIDVLFEGTSQGLDAQEARLRELAARLTAAQADAGAWKGRQKLWSYAQTAQPRAIAKISMLPACIGTVLDAVRRVASACGTRWTAVVQATGLGLLRLDGAPEAMHASLIDLRATLERQGGSLVILSRPAEMAALDAWGSSGDAGPLMRAIKRQFDPKGTLNPGRFVEGI
jgi:glycolate oxidase FAD binding subunit